MGGQITRLEESNRDLKNRVSQLERKFDLLLQNHQKVVQERDQLAVEMSSRSSQMRHSGEASAASSVKQANPHSDVLICVGGEDRGLHLYDPDLRLKHCLGDNKCVRVVHALLNVRDPDALTVAASQRYNHGVDLWDVEEKRCIGGFVCASGYGLACIPTTLSRSARFLSGYHPAKVDVVTANGKVLGELDDPPKETHRIHCVPEWSMDFVFVGGTTGRDSNNFLTRYDLNRLDSGAKDTFELLGKQHAGEDLASDVGRGILFSSDGGWSHTTHLWAGRDPDQGLLASLSLRDYSHSLYFCSDKNLLLVGLSKGMIEVWDPRQVRTRVKCFRIRPKRAPGHSQTTYDLDRIGDDVFVAVGGQYSKEGFVTTWNLMNGSVMSSITPKNCTGVRVLPKYRDGRQLEFREEMERFQGLRNLCRWTVSLRGFAEMPVAGFLALFVLGE